jgi:hypothetical protein
MRGGRAALRHFVFVQLTFAKFSIAEVWLFCHSLPTGVFGRRHVSLALVE